MQGTQQRADPVDSTMHDPAEGVLQDGVVAQSSGPTILHGISASNMANVLHLLGSLFPGEEGENRWQELAHEAQKEQGCATWLACFDACTNRLWLAGTLRLCFLATDAFDRVAMVRSGSLDPGLVERIRLYLAQIKESDMGSNGEGRLKTSCESIALSAYVTLLGQVPGKGNVLTSAAPTVAESARETMLQLLQACVNTCTERATSMLPAIDATSALSGVDQVLDLDAEALADTDRQKPSVVLDEV
jgi:hypothetical protein